MRTLPALKVVGLTGGIGSGKSTVARMFEQLGVTIIDADRLAKAAVARGSPGLSAIVDCFGPEVLDADGHLDRRSVGRRVFKDAEARAALNAIVHPEVARRSAEAVQAAAEAGARLAIYDVPLLYENGLERTLSEVVVVTVDPDVQRTRIAKRDDLPPDEVSDRIAAQMPLADKAAKADYVIDNNGDLEVTRRQVQALFDRWMQDEPS